MADPQLAGRSFSGNDSGTATMMKRTSSSATAVAIQMTTVSLYKSWRYAPSAGLVTRLAAKVADTWVRKTHRQRCQKHISMIERLMEVDSAAGESQHCHP